MIAIVMAGGKGKRMGNGVEKSLIKIGNKTLLKRVISAIKRSKLEPVVAVSKHTPETKKKARELGLDVFETPGEGYVKDIQFVLRKMELDNALVVSADLPFITPALIKGVVEEYNNIRRPICVATQLEEYERSGFKASTVILHKGEKLVPVGINVVEKTEREDYFYITSGIETLNINTLEELDIAKKISENG